MRTVTIKVDQRKVLKELYKNYNHCPKILSPNIVRVPLIKDSASVIALGDHRLGMAVIHTNVVNQNAYAYVSEVYGCCVDHNELMRYKGKWIMDGRKTWKGNNNWNRIISEISRQPYQSGISGSGLNLNLISYQTRKKFGICYDDRDYHVIDPEIFKIEIDWSNEFIYGLNTILKKFVPWKYK